MFKYNFDGIPNLHAIATSIFETTSAFIWRQREQEMRRMGGGGGLHTGF
jgi:hypothetical protein